MFAVGDQVVVVDTGETGVVVEVYGMGCYNVLLIGWPEACQIREEQLALTAQCAQED